MTSAQYIDLRERLKALDTKLQRVLFERPAVALRSAVKLHRLDGSWAGVCLDGLARVRVKDGDLVVSRLDAPKAAIWTREVGSVRFVDCWSHETTGEIRVGFTKGEQNKDHVYVVAETGAPVFLGRGKTVQVRRKDGRWVVMISRPSDGDGCWVLVDVDSGAVVAKGQDADWSSMGIIDLTADWKPVWYHPVKRTVTVDGLKLQLPRKSGPWIAAQGSNPSTLLVACGKRAGMLLQGEAREPKVVALPDGRGAVVSRVERGYGVAFAILTPADVAALPKPATPTKPPKPPDPPDDGDDGDDMTSAEYLDLRDRMARLEAKLDRALANWPDVPDGPPTEPGTPEPPSNPDAPSIDTASVTWLTSGNPLDFTVGSQILDVTIEKKKDDGSTPYSDDNCTVCFPHTMAGKWPVLTNAEGLKYEGNVCVFGRVGGKWYGAAAEWLKVDQMCKRLTNRREKDSWGIGPHTKKEPLQSWGPASGEWIGIMVCTPVRDGVEGPSQERSQIYMVRWP